MASLAEGDRVVVDFMKAAGKVRYFGTSHFALGTWVGLELDEAVGKNNGSVSGVRYFDCVNLHGLFVRPTALRKEGSLSEAEDQNDHEGRLWVGTRSADDMARDAVSDVAKQLHAIVDDARELCATARRGLVAQSDQHNSPSGEEANSHEQDQTVNSVLSVLLQGAAMKRNSLTTAADVSARRTSLRALGEVLCVGESSGSSGKSDTSAESPVQDTRAVAALAAPRPVVGFTSRRQSEEEIGPRLDSFMGDGFLRGALKSSRGAKEPDIIVHPPQRGSMGAASGGQKLSIVVEVQDAYGTTSQHINFSELRGGEVPPLGSVLDAVVHQVVRASMQAAVNNSS